MVIRIRKRQSVEWLEVYFVDRFNMDYWADWINRRYSFSVSRCFEAVQGDIRTSKRMYTSNLWMSVPPVCTKDIAHTLQLTINLSFGNTEQTSLAQGMQHYNQSCIRSSNYRLIMMCGECIAGFWVQPYTTYESRISLINWYINQYWGYEYSIRPVKTAIQYVYWSFIALKSQATTSNCIPRTRSTMQKVACSIFNLTKLDFYS